MQFPNKPVLAATLLLGIMAAFLVATAATWPGALAAARAAETRVPVIAYVHTGIWWATLINTAGIALLLFTRRWWNLPLPPIPPAEISAPLRRGRLKRTTMVFFLLAAVGLGAAFRLPRIDVGFSADEEDSLRHHLLGRYQQRDDGEVRFRQATWTDTFFKNHQLNNHVLFSVLARSVLEGWQELGPDREGRFAEFPTRIPCLLAGLGAIFLVGWFLHSLGYSMAGAGAAFLLAMHPWHIRYSAESRGYSLNICFVLLTLHLLHRALTRGQWRYWTGFALAQCALLYSYAGSIYVPLLLNAFTLLALLFRLRGKDPYPAGVQIRRLLVANALSAMLFLQFMAPSLPQIQEVLAERRGSVTLGPRYLTNMGAYLAAGMPWFPTDPESPLHHSAVTDGAKFFVGILVPLAMLGGAWRLARASGFHAAYAGTLLFCAPLGLLHAFVSDNRLHLWYLIFALPGVAILASLGVTGLAASARSPASYRRRARRILILFLAIFWFQTRPQRIVIMHHPKEPLQEVIAMVYGETDPFSPEGRAILTAGFYTDATIYDPWLYYTDTPGHLVTMMERALDEKKPLYLTYGHRALSEKHYPDLVALADNPDLFKPLHTFHGLEEPQFTHYLLKFTGTRDTLRSVADNPVATPRAVR